MAERIADKYGYRNMGQVGHSLLSQKLPLIVLSPSSSCFCQLLKVSRAMVLNIPPPPDKRYEGQTPKVVMYKPKP